MDVTIRAAVDADAAAIGRLHVRAWQSAYRGVMPDEYLDGLQPEERAAMWTSRISRADVSPLLVAELAGEVVGFADFGRAWRASDPPDAGELYAINLDPAHWGKGIGRTLLREAVARLGALGFTEAVLWVVPGNVRARSLYESEGWVVDGGVSTGEVLGVTVPEIRYRCACRR